MRILLIPHFPHSGAVRTRSQELARHLGKIPGNEVFLLDWQPSQTQEFRSLVHKILVRMSEAIRSLLRSSAEVREGEYTKVVLPHLRFPPSLDRLVNEVILRRYIKTHSIQCVINANAFHFGVPKGQHEYIYDIVDDHISKDDERPWRRTRRFVLNELEKANSVTTVSEGLRQVVHQHSPDSRTGLVPNGVDVKRWRNPDLERVRRIRLEYGLDRGSYSLSFIGNHGWHSGLDFLLSAFSEFRKESSAKLLIVGPVSGMESFPEFAQDGSVIFTGPVDSNRIMEYFHATDAGVLPFVLSPFTHNSFPMKVLEYGAARRPVFSSPLRELRRISLPHVELLPLETQQWVAAWTRHSKSIGADNDPWEEDWDTRIEAYDWQVMANRLDSAARGSSSGRGAYPARGAAKS